MPDIQFKEYDSLAKAFVGVFGKNISILTTNRVTGGDINKAYQLILNNGKTAFMKANAFENKAFFVAESSALTALKQTNTIGIPEVFCYGSDKGEEVGYSFLLEEFISSAKQAKDYWTTFGHELAELHKADTKHLVPDGQFGFDAANFIGATPQDNTPHATWINFFRDCRLLPQIKKADHYFDDALRAKFQKLLDNLDHFLVEPDFPSLLHGDLWSGNVVTGPDGHAWLVDPASYCGFFEIDLAMTELFGRFPDEFYQAYAEINPISAEYHERKDLYNLYQILNHLNLFGPTYLQPTSDIISEYIN
ncbi:MAG: fructosamine kinase family protein [Treponema sp.]|nr:fructosamine kinase family protein [Treponema sp.]